MSFTSSSGPRPHDARHGDDDRDDAQRGLRAPHRRRAEAGQQTGLNPSLASEAPSWLSEERIQTVPPRRLVGLSVAAFAGLLTLALVLGAYTRPGSYALVIFGGQLLFILAFTVAMRPPGLAVVVVTGVLAAIGADLAAALPRHASLGPVGYVTAAAFGLGVIGQLARGSRRVRATESLGATLMVVLGVVAFSSLVVLSREKLGTESIVACLVAGGVAVVVARLTDVVLPSPRTSPHVARGTIGVVLGAMAGTVAAGATSSFLVGLNVGRTVLAGLVTAMAAVAADLAVSYAQAGRELSGAKPSLWVARHMQGPLGAFALAAPAAYALSVMVLVPALS